MRDPQTRINSAQLAFENGFQSKAGQKRALDDLNRAYGYIREILMRAILAARSPETEAQNHEDYWAVPNDLHQIRERHFELAARYVDNFGIVRDMIALRNAIKGAEIAPPPARPELEVKADTVRRTIVEEMERRKTMFVEGLELGRLFAELYPRTGKDGEALGPSASLPVTVNAHWVRGHKGTDFVRHFFYLGGKLTPLNMIMAVADQLEREHEAGTTAPTSAAPPDDTLPSPG
jgi:hypothetical protein